MDWPAQQFLNGDCGSTITATFSVSFYLINDYTYLYGICSSSLCNSLSNILKILNSTNINLNSLFLKQTFFFNLPSIITVSNVSNGTLNFNSNLNSTILTNATSINNNSNQTIFSISNSTTTSAIITSSQIQCYSGFFPNIQTVACNKSINCFSSYGKFTVKSFLLFIKVA